MPLGGWEGADSRLARYLADSNDRTLQSYESKPEWVEEHAHIEQAIAEGGYGHRQVYELVQNGADAMVRRSGGRIEVILTDTHLYCANEGDPIDEAGLGAMLSSNTSRKRGEEIGRFGLGFKSVLAVTDRPEFYSRPVSLRFSDGYSASLINDHIGTVDFPHPILRLGEPLDPSASAQSDPILDELMSWSVTVVRLPRDASRDTSWLARDLSDFPAEFLLFTRHVNQLILDDRVAGVNRTITVQRGGEDVRLVEGEVNQRWRVFRKVVEPTDAARKDAGRRQERDRLPVDWAVPMSGPTSIGKFWAFFPTTFETTLSGILNAPWKTNPDRENLLRGDFNEFLIDVAAALVVDNLHQVSSADDPGRHLDRMPARGREARAWADRRITEEVYRLASTRESLPNQRGELDLPANLRLHPERVPKVALDLWSTFDFRPHRWVHASVETRERRPRVERLLEASRDGRNDEVPPVATYREWLEALASPSTPKASAAALQVAELLKGQLSPIDFEEIRSAQIVLTTSGNLVPPDPNKVFVGGRPDIEDTAEVDPEVVTDPFAERALRNVFRVADVDKSAEFGAFLATGGASDDYWSELWKRAERLPADQALVVLTRRFTPGELRVRTLAGTFRPLRSALLAGPIATTDGSDTFVTIDEGWHAENLELLRALGATDVPHANRAGFDSPPTWFADYVDFVRDEFNVAGIALRGNSIEPNLDEIPSHLEVLPELSDEVGARLTNELLRLPTTQNVWTWRASGPVHLDTVDVMSPSAWMIKQHGTLMTTRGLRPVNGAVSATLAEFGRLLPVSRLSAEATSVLALPHDVAECPKPVLAASLESLVGETDDDLIGKFVSALAKVLPPPTALPCRVGLGHGLHAPSEITAIADTELYAQLRAIDTPIVLAPTAPDAARLVAKWRLREQGDLITIEIGYQPASPEVPLIDEFPGLRLLPSMGGHREKTLIRCKELTRTVRAQGGQTTVNVDRAFSESRVYWRIDEGPDPHENDAALLGFISSQLNLDLVESQISALLQNRIDEGHRKLLQRIREQPDEESRLLITLGPEALRRYVPTALVEAVEEQGHTVDDRKLAEMALSVHGVDILREAKNELEMRGLQPPSQWAGGRVAQEFVRDLGFPREYAGFPEDRRDQAFEVIGPVELKKLHDFQEEVGGRLRDLLRSTERRKRAMLSLPTGAGKTRVAVESLVEHFNDDEIHAPVLWIAQSDELCEQAVQAWAEVWRAKGPPTSLTISRLWDVNSAEPTGGPQVVVATIQKLDAAVIEQPRYEWLSEAGVVIVDEAHRGATTPTTTRLLKWLGLNAGDARGTDRCALIGLTATPFIGANQIATETLVRRYGRKRLDDGLFPEDNTEQLITLLQHRGILSRVVHRRIDGIQIDLDEAQMDELTRFSRLPRAVEAELGLNAARNRTLVDSIRGLDPDWQVLLFAASVENAQTLAALLQLENITAAAVTAETRPGARRHYVEQFKRRNIRVLTNYGTLTTGFDAPEVRAVYVARPTYSPNLYLQMIGRGLRGPANGGTDECLIVDVEDNVRMYGGKLAFTDFEFLWDER
ncbi:DEAD/DEAH box helicase [Mycolicibacterium sp. GCM10028919]|uniref:DEAD/DEAH box helicase n=1 Tax=Mycolicibacterium sp. GCM10028919 TaxID=3273401 RepID=UPI003605BE65